MLIGGTVIDGRFLLAPLAGITDSPMRILCRRMGAAMVYSEMASSEALVRDGEKTLDILRFRPDERPIALQLFGARPEAFSEAARRLRDLKPDFIDINAGCPARKVIKSGSGAALLRDLPLLGEISAAVVEAADCPVTAKIRSGWDETSVNAVETARVLEDAGVSAVALHPRTRSQQFDGEADWSLIGEVARAVEIPVIGSGDVRAPEDAVRMLDETQCDAVMIGRAAIGNPWIFEATNELRENAVPARTAALATRLGTCIEHLDLMVEAKGERKGVLEMRKHLVRYFKGFPGASRLRYELVRTEGHARVRKMLESALSEIEDAPDLEG